MKHPGHRHRRVVDILRERESELLAIRSNFAELENKFFQLENAFRINLAAQRRLESELELCKHGRAGEKSSGNFPDETAGKSAKARAALRSRVSRIRVERERWKDAFRRQKKSSERQKLEHERTIATMRDECEKILKNCRESGEKHFRELLELHRVSGGKARRLQEALGASEARASSTRDRILELANLLETLEKFRGLRSEVVCGRTARALRSLTGDEEKSHHEDMRSLRRVTWDVSGKHENDESLEFLQAQNSVLREIVKSLKRKFRDEVSNNDDDENENANGVNNCNSIVVESPEDNPKNPLDQIPEAKEKIRPQIEAENPGTSESRSSLPNEITREDREEDKQKSNRRIYVEFFESHRDGIPLVEYAIPGRQFRVRHRKTPTSDSRHKIVEFVDSLENFETAPIDRTVFYLGENVEKILTLGNSSSSRHCGVQTSVVRRLEKSAQTTLTGTKRFFQLNSGVGVLNSEKRAMERSLANLERTVASLKADALGQAHSIIVRDARSLGDEFFSCLKRLEG